MTSAITWFEIPAVDMHRAIRFYNAVLLTQLEAMPADDPVHAFFPHFAGPQDVGGSLTKGEGHVPSRTGTLVYLHTEEDVDVVLARVEAAGGQVILPKTSIGENGHIGVFADSEGNRVGVHTQN